MLRSTLLLIITLLFTTSGLAESGTYPRVLDGAGVLTPATTSTLEQLIQTTQATTTAELMVMTVPSIEGGDIDILATRLFNRIAIGRADTNNGVLFLIAPADRRTRIEVGYGLEPLITDALAGEILDTEVIPRFKDGDIQGGIVAGTREITRILQRYPEAAHGVPGSAPRYVRTAQRDFTNALMLGAATGALLLGSHFWIRRSKHYPVVLMYFLFALAVISVASAVAAFVVLGQVETLPVPATLGASGILVTGLWLARRQFRRFGPRRCDKCGSPMRMLSEHEDDQQLTEVQRLEEQLGAVDYDVWHCPACLHSDTERYVALFSSFATCPKCSARTWKEEVTTLVSATTSSTGKERVDGRCLSCQHKSSKVRTTPRISESSGSGGGSSGSSGSDSSGGGGGSSGGGGASRSW